MLTESGQGSHTLTRTGCGLKLQLRITPTYTCTNCLCSLEPTTSSNDMQPWEHSKMDLPPPTKKKQMTYPLLPKRAHKGGNRLTAVTMDSR